MRKGCIIVAAVALALLGVILYCIAWVGARTAAPHPGEIVVEATAAGLGGRDVETLKRELNVFIKREAGDHSGMSFDYSWELGETKTVRKLVQAPPGFDRGKLERDLADLERDLAHRMGKVKLKLIVGGASTEPVPRSDVPGAPSMTPAPSSAPAAP